MKITTKKLQEFKEQNKKITSITAYDYSTAKFFDEAGIDMILVGDSLAQVVLGYDSTTKISMNEMKIFTSAVSRGVKNCFLVSDMPFMSYQADLTEAIKNAGELIKCGADAVKIEGCTDYILEVVKRITEAGIPVVGHLGFTPQSVGVIGGYKVIGKKFEATLKLLEDAKKLEKMGAVAIVFEMVPKESAEFVTKELKTPTIGIGAGVNCDGQILVSDDVLGKYSDFCPKFAKKYADLEGAIKNAVKNYINDVREEKFPTDKESFSLEIEEKTKLEDYKNNKRN